MYQIKKNELQSFEGLSGYWNGTIKALDYYGGLSVVFLWCVSILRNIYIAFCKVILRVFTKSYKFILPNIPLYYSLENNIAPYDLILRPIIHIAQYDLILRLVK